MSLNILFLHVVEKKKKKPFINKIGEKVNLIMPLNFRLF